jgi:hypothetical protein
MERLAGADDGEDPRIRAEPSEAPLTDVDDLEAIDPARKRAEDGIVPTAQGREIEIAGVDQCDGHHVDVTDVRVKAAGDRRSIQVQGDQIRPERSSELVMDRADDRLDLS